MSKKKRVKRPIVYAPRVGTEVTWRNRRVRIVEVVQDAATYQVVAVRVTNVDGSQIANRGGLQSNMITLPSSLEKILEEAHRVEGI